MILTEEERAMILAHRDSKNCANKVLKTAVAKEDIFFPSSKIKDALFGRSYFTTSEKEEFLKTLNKKNAFKLIVPKGASFYLLQYSYIIGFNVCKKIYWHADDSASHNIGLITEERENKYLTNIQELNVPLSLEDYKKSRCLK